jgi:hypothetical protein
MIIRSSAYLSRNRYSDCFRIKIPKELHRHFGKKELRYSLKTGYLGLAKSRSRLLAGLTQKLFAHLRGAGYILVHGLRNCANYLYQRLRKLTASES